MNYPGIEAIADVRKLGGCLAEEGLHIAIVRWRDTAWEIAPDLRVSIQNHFIVYDEIAKSVGLSVDQVLLFVDGLLGLLPSKEDQQRLILIQATGAIK